MLISDRAGPRMRHLGLQLQRYSGAMGWLVGKLWRAFRWRLVRAIASAQVGVIVVGAGVALAVYYAQELESDGQLQVGQLTLGARDETTLTIMVAVVLLVLLAGGGVLLFAQRSIVSMAAELNHHVRMDVATAYGGELPDSTGWHNNRAVWRALWVLQTRDARRTAIVTRNLLRNTVHVGIAVVGFAALFYLEALMTVLFVGVMLVALLAYYYVNIVSVRATRRYETVAPGARKALHQLLQRSQTLSQPRLSGAELEPALGNDTVEEETHAFRDRFGAHIYTEFLSFAIMGVVLAGLIGYMGGEALAGAMPWTRLVAYMVVLRLTLNSLRSVFATFAFFSRFYPSIERLHRFFCATNSQRSPETLEALPLHLSSQTLTERAELTEPIRPGEIVGVTLPVALSRYSLGLLAPVFAGPDPKERRRVIGHMAMAAPLSVPQVAASMRGLLMMDAGWEETALRARLGEYADDVEAAVGLDPDAVVPAEAWGRLPREAADRLVLVAAEASERPVLAVEAGLVTGEWIHRLCQGRQGRIVLLCGSGSWTPNDGSEMRREFVVSPASQIVAIGSPTWVRQRWDTISQHAPEGHAAEIDSDDDLDEE